MCRAGESTSGVVSTSTLVSKGGAARPALALMDLWGILGQYLSSQALRVGRQVVTAYFVSAIYTVRPG